MLDAIAVAADAAAVAAAAAACIMRVTLYTISIPVLTARRSTIVL
jgi:hypothetical protein